MASITLTGTLLDPTGEVAVGDQIRFTHRTTTGETIQFARSVLIIPPNGLYNITLEFGLIFVEYLDVKDVHYKNLGVVTVNGDTTATDLPGLLNAIVPPTDAQLLLFQGILADTEDARDIALLAAAQQTTLELIASTTTHPNSTVLTLSGHTLPGDGGGGKWQLNGVVGQTPNQSPTQLADFLLNDGNGNQWALVDGVILAFNGVQYLPLPFGATGNGNYAYNDNDFDKITDPDRLNPATVAAMIADTSIEVGDKLNTIDYYSTQKGGSAPYLVKTAAQVATDGDVIDEFGNHTLDTGDFAIIQVTGWVIAKQFGLKGDTTTDDSAAEAALSVSPHLFQLWTDGVYQTGLNNGTSDRTYLFTENCIIDGVIHVTGVGPATTPPTTLSIVENVRMLGTATTTIRFGTFYCTNLYVDKIHQLAPDAQFVNQTISGATGVHLFFGTKQFRCNEIIVEDANAFGGFTADQGPVKGADELQEDNRIGRLIINKVTNVTPMVTAENKNLRIDEIIIKGQSGANVGWISVDDIGLKVGDLTHSGLGADSGQNGIYLMNTDPDSSAEFGTVDVSMVPGIGFRTFNVGTVDIGTLIVDTNREGCRLQSKCTIQHIRATNNSQVGILLNDNAAAGSFIGSIDVTGDGAGGIGVTVGSDDVVIPYIKADNFPTLYGLNINAGVKRFQNKYLESSNAAAGFRCLSSGPIDMGVLNLHDNVDGLIASGMSDFGFDYAIYANNSNSDTNTVLEFLPGFRGKKVRQSVGVDRGDTAVVLTIGVDQITQQFNTPLTVNRNITITSPATNGDKFRVVRTAAATGVSTLTIILAGGNKVLAVGEWADVEFVASAWILTGAGAL